MQEAREPGGEEGRDGAAREAVRRAGRAAWGMRIASWLGAAAALAVFGCGVMADAPPSPFVWVASPLPCVLGMGIGGGVAAGCRWWSAGRLAARLAALPAGAREALLQELEDDSVPDTRYLAAALRGRARGAELSPASAPAGGEREVTPGSSRTGALRSG